MASILDLLGGSGSGGSGLGSALVGTMQNFNRQGMSNFMGQRYNPSGDGSLAGLSGGGVQGSQGGNQLPFDPTSGRVPNYLQQSGGSGGGYQAGQQVQPHLGGIEGRMQRLGQAFDNTSPIREYIASSLFGGGGQGSSGGGLGSNLGSLFSGSLSPGAGGGGQGLDADTLYRVFGISPSTTGYRTPLASISPRARGEGGPAMQIYEDYAHGPQRESFSSRFGEYA